LKQHFATGLIKFLKLERDRLLQSSGTASQCSSNTFDEFVRIARDILASESRDLDELRTLFATLWYGINLPMMLEEETLGRPQQGAAATQKLFTNRAIMTQVSTKVASREVTPRKWLEDTERDLRRRKALDEDERAGEVEATWHKRKRRRCGESRHCGHSQLRLTVSFILQKYRPQPHLGSHRLSLHIS
jgi:hypothetical protein